jgi:hypothetical protein
MLKLSKKQAIFFSVVSATIALSVAPPAIAQTTSTTAPASVLDPFKEGANDMDDIAGLAAAVGISSVVFGGGALIFKRFIYG